MNPVPAIVLTRQDLGEADRIVRLLTPEHGRVDVIARGARASRHRYPGALETGARLELTWTRSRGELPTLGSVDIVAVPVRARQDYRRLVLVAWGCEVVLALSEAGLDALKGFGLLCAWLDRLEAEAPVSEAVRLAFEAKALTFAGLAPRLAQCAACGEVLSGVVAFDPEAGGGVHAHCGTGTQVADAALAAVERLRRAPLAEIEEEAPEGVVRWLLADFIEHHTRRPLKARALLVEAT